MTEPGLDWKLRDYRMPLHRQRCTLRAAVLSPAGVSRVLVLRLGRGAVSEGVRDGAVRGRPRAAGFFSHRVDDHRDREPLRGQPRAIRFVSEVVGRLSRRRPGAAALFPPLCSSWSSLLNADAVSSITPLRIACARTWPRCSPR